MPFQDATLEEVFTEQNLATDTLIKMLASSDEFKNIAASTSSLRILAKFVRYSARHVPLELIVKLVNCIDYDRFVSLLLIIYLLVDLDLFAMFHLVSHI